ncbi:hypothetical protein Ahy_B07g087249 [Arachis hypogaea]|uniref:POX domain-containing protein n=1 Tax=Arachis hypogaea TaxID=3818 RepID=A0A444YBJ4_ARAHY|nr:hypothetical protein Ahy_B07g087249 [Arachis hypogaea]
MPLSHPADLFDFHIYPNNSMDISVEDNYVSASDALLAGMAAGAVDRRYKNYQIQMKAVVSSFEAVAGNGAATVYTTLAQKAMSKYFRNLKDAIMGQIQATKKAMGEKDPVAPGTTKGETLRLKIIDQALRQQRAFQQMSMMETHPWRPQRGLPECSVSVLHPGASQHNSSVSNWFINARVRLAEEECLGRVMDTFGSVELDFSSYTQQQQQQ